MKKLFIFISVSIILSSTNNYCAAQGAYAETDKEALRKFLRNKSVTQNKLNIDYLWIGNKVDTSKWYKSEDWVHKIKGITWDLNQRPQFHLGIIDWTSAQYLAGTLNLKGCDKISQLYCANNKITAIVLGKNPTLTRIICNNNSLTAIDVSGCSALNSLSCANNRLKKLNVENNKVLSVLVCDNNMLKTLDISKNKLLTFLNCWNNELSTLNTSNNPALMNLLCSSNKFQKLDLSNNPVLVKLYCDNNLLTSLDLSKNNSLSLLVITNNRFKISTLPVAKQNYSAEYRYSPQTIINLGSMKMRDTIDLSRELRITDENGIAKISNYKWFILEKDIEYAISNKLIFGSKGKFIFYHPSLTNKRLRCKVQNDAIGKNSLIYEFHLEP